MKSLTKHFAGISSLSIFSLIVVLLLNCCWADIVVWDEEDNYLITVDSTFIEFRKNQIFNDAIYLSVIDPSMNGCDKLPRPPNIISLSDQRPSWVLLMDNNHDCEAHEKILNVQNAGYEGLILIAGSRLTDAEMLDINPEFKSKFKINVSLIRHIDGVNLKQFSVKTRQSKRYTLTIKGKIPTTTTTPKVVEETTTTTPKVTEETSTEKPIIDQTTPVPPPPRNSPYLVYIALGFLLPPGLYFLSRFRLQDLMALSGMIGVVLIVWVLSKNSVEL